jgi:hypothetical protein
VFLSRDAIFLSISITAVEGTFMCVMSLIFVHICDISSVSYYSMYDVNTDLYLINLLLFVSVFD